MANATGRDALVQHAQNYAQECLQELEAFKQVEQNYRNAVRALKALGVSDEPAKAKGGKRAGAGRPPASAEGNGKGTGYRPPGTTIGDQVEAILRKHPKGLTVAEMAAELPKGTPRNSIHSAFRSIVGRGIKMATAKAASGPALTYLIKP